MRILTIGLAGLLISAGALRATTLSEFFPEVEPLCQKALDGGPMGNIFELRTQEANANARASRSVLWPSLVGDSQYNYIVEDRKDFTDLVTRSNYRTALNASYPVYHWGAVQAAAKRGRETQKQARLLNKAEQQGLRTQIETLYVGIMLKQKRIAVAQSELEGSRRQQMSLGNLSEAEAENKRLEQQQKALEVERLEGEKEVLLRKLARLTGRGNLSEAPGAATKELASLPSNLPLNFDFKGFPEKLEIPAEWNTQPLQATLASLDNESHAAEERLWGVQTKAETLPQVDVVGGFYQDQVDGVNVSKPVDRNNYYVGVRLRWELFNGWRSQSNAAAARSRQRRYRALAAQNLAEAQETLMDDKRTLKMTASSYEIALARHRMTQKRLEAQKVLQGQGQSSQEAFEAAQRENLGSEITALESLTNFLMLYEKIQQNFEVR